MRLLSAIAAPFKAIDRAFMAYADWYDANIAPSREASNFPKCPFCGKRDYRVGQQMLTNSRVWNQFVRAIVTCNTCGMQFQAARDPHSRKWRFNQSS